MNKNYSVIDRMLNGQIEVVEISPILDCTEKEYLQDVEIIPFEKVKSFTFCETEKSTSLPMISFGKVNTCNIFKK